jgi:hypothetical protein
MTMIHSLTIRSLAVALACTVIASIAVAQLAPPPNEDQLRAAGALKIVGDDLAKLLNNQTLEHTNLGSGQTYFIFYRADGRRFLRLGSGVRETKWWIKDDLRCEDSVATGTSVCHSIYKQGDVYRVCTVGEQRCNWLVESVMPGDTHKLVK